MEQKPKWSSLARENISEEKWREYEKFDDRPIDHLVHPMVAILEELRPNIEKGSYKVILGEDASGRIPTLMMSEVMNELYDRKGHEHPLVRFVAGSRHLDKEDPAVAENKRNMLVEHIQRIGKDAGLRSDSEENASGVKEKFLIVTETIGKGSSMRELLKAVRDAGFDADIAAITIDEGKKGESRAEFDGAFVAYGGTGTAPIWDNHEMGGVKKKNTDLFAKPFGDPKVRGLARIAVKLSSESVVERYLEKEKQQQFKDAA